MINDIKNTGNNLVTSSKTTLDDYLKLLALTVDMLVPNEITTDTTFIENNIEKLSADYKQLSFLRNDLWLHWENIIMSDLKDSIKDAYFNRFQLSLNFNYDRYRQHYNQTIFEEAKHTKMLYQTASLKAIIYGMDGLFANDLAELHRFQELYQLDVKQLKKTEQKHVTAETNVYKKVAELEANEEITEAEFSNLIKEFNTQFLDRKKYYHRISLHRNPIEVKNEVLRGLYTYLLQIQNREEMRDNDIEKNAWGNVPTIVMDIWRSDKRLRSCYNAIKEYCQLRSKDFNVIAIHIAEYRAMSKLATKISRDIHKLDQIESTTKGNKDKTKKEGSVLKHQGIQEINEADAPVIENLIAPFDKYLSGIKLDHKKISSIINATETFAEKISIYAKFYGVLKSGGRIFTKDENGNEADKIFCVCSNCRLNVPEFESKYKIYEPYLIREFNQLKSVVESELPYKTKLIIWDNVFGGSVNLKFLFSTGDCELALKPSSPIEIEIQNKFCYDKMLEKYYKNTSSMPKYYEQDFKTQQQKFITQYSHALYRNDLKTKTITTIKNKFRNGEAAQFFNLLVDGSLIDYSNELLEFQTMFSLVFANEAYLLLSFIEGYSLDKSISLQPGKTVGPIHFEDLSGAQFERLVFALLHKLKNWDKIEWLGQTGNDQGRDIWGVYKGEKYCYQCANYRRLTFGKVEKDINKLSASNHLPDHLIVVSGGTVSAKLRTKINNCALSRCIQDTYVWSAGELEEILRNQAPDVLKRFNAGDAFPEFQ